MMRKITVKVLQTNGMNAFRSLDVVGRRNVRLSEYSCVYTGTVYTTNDNYMLTLPEQLFEEFNCDIPESWNGRSMSVSDLLFIEENGQGIYMYCDSHGFEFVIPKR